MSINRSKQLESVSLCTKDSNFSYLYNITHKEAKDD